MTLQEVTWHELSLDFVFKKLFCVHKFKVQRGEPVEPKKAGKKTDAVECTIILRSICTLELPKRLDMILMTNFNIKKNKQFLFIYIQIFSLF